jgi:hypothetical protein
MVRPEGLKCFGWMLTVSEAVAVEVGPDQGAFARPKRARETSGEAPAGGFEDIINRGLAPAQQAHKPVNSTRPLGQRPWKTCRGESGCLRKAASCRASSLSSHQKVSFPHERPRGTLRPLEPLFLGTSNSFCSLSTGTPPWGAHATNESEALGGTLFC